MRMESIEREPRPGRTKRGAGAGAKLDLSIYYYRAADGIGPDYGTYYGQDDEGRWELHFEGPKEMESQFARVVSVMSEVATEAREESESREAKGREVHLKAIGAQGWP